MSDAERLKAWAERLLDEHGRYQGAEGFHCGACGQDLICMDETSICDARRAALMVLVALESLDESIEPMALHLMASHLPLDSE